jgi:deoxyribodipyrimidine photolyase-related protein
MPVDSLRLVLGDQLSRANPALAGLDPARDRVAMIEAADEATHVRSHKARIVLFLSAMRHFAAALRADGVPLDYLALEDAPPGAAPSTLADRLDGLILALRPRELVVCEPGEWRVLVALQDLAARRAVPLRVLPDTHFLCSTDEFARWAGRGRALRMEAFYRRMRVRHRVLMRDDGEPEGGRWNFDEDNRGAFPKAGPGPIPAPARFEPDAITREAIALVERRFPDHPGSLDAFGWPVTREQALEALARFVRSRLAGFGRHQDAMWSGTPFGWHALLASSLNLKLIDPREVIDAAERAWRAQPAAERDAASAPLSIATVEGFVRQVLGWREFVRGVYWLEMPGLARANHFGADRPLPAWWWSADTRMACLRETVGQTMREGYAHHIQRLMVTGNFALLAGLAPSEVAAWYLAVYVDAVEWVELPNVAGMALYANGGRFTTKPYAASGAYVKRMSDYCRGCAYAPEVRTGPRACPMTTLYWRFLDAHEAELASNPRTVLMARSVARLSPDERAAIRDWGERLLADLDGV